MNTPLSAGDEHNLRYAEYVLGVLDADQRAAVAREIATNDEAAVAVALWQRHLLPLAETVPEVTPSEQVWVQIRQALSWDESARATRPTSLWQNLRLWQWIGAAATAVAVACIVMLLNAPPRGRPAAPHGILMVSSIRQENGVTDWTATMDLDRKEIVVLPAAATPIPPDRSTQLWLIPAGQRPISVGVFKSDSAAALPLTPALLAQLGPTAALAVSVEPPGGSPTGQPTGAVIAKGAIGAAPTPAA